ncbi:FG-GAP-like repeat-containing protein [Streptomyces fenghuangensis]|uniref:FG-GAP-like repeat-containing protein n=1 Tax=Streptomyces sp. ICN903 TaxID=2964654 RepID=UPI001EDB3B45|nr:FG-GAP-like repeat-containing protein [Streptomyces sp. ICN903]MCG3044452.1 integrin alpha [Streptomyces sp. ICN903]
MHNRFRTALAAATVAALTGGLMAATAGSAAAEGDRPTADFNGDGFRDLAVSAPFATVNGQKNAGQVVVLYGSANGITTTSKRTVVSQDSPGVPGASEAGDGFGHDTTAADFNDDGFTDLAVGTPREKVGKDVNGGTVQIIWGSASGLYGGTTVPDPAPSSHDRFGYVLDAADYDGDDLADLAVGTSSSYVRVFRGGFGKSKGEYRGAYGVRPAILSGADTGPMNLHSGDVNGDDIADLVVDGYERDAADGGDYHWNANYYVPGSASGLTAGGQRKLPAGLITDIGDVNSDGFGDIVIGMEFDADSGVPGSRTGGLVNVLHGSPSGPDGTRRSFTQDTPGVPGGSERYDGFGAELDLGDVNGDGHLDLAVGAPGESLDDAKYTGAVVVLYGAADGSGLTGSGSQFIHQDTPGVPGGNEAEDQFGSDVHLADMNDDGLADLTVGALGENNGNGAVTALRSDGTRIAGGGYFLSVSRVGVSTAGTPLFGVNFAG